MHKTKTKTKNESESGRLAVRGWNTYQVAMHHGKVIARHVPELHLVNIQVLVPPVGPKVAAVVKKEKGMAKIGIGQG